MARIRNSQSLEGKVSFSFTDAHVTLPIAHKPIRLKKNIGLFLVWINFDTKKELRNKVSALTKLCGELLGR